MLDFYVRGPQVINLFLLCIIMDYGLKQKSWFKVETS